MGVLAPESAHARPSAQPPIDTSGNFPAHVSAVTFLKFPHFPVKIGLFRGVGGVPEIIFFIEILLFLLLRSPCKKLKPYDNPFWGFEQGYQEINNKKRKFPLAPMGVLGPGSAHARLSAWPPIDTSRNFQAHMSTHVCRVTF
jgi:hypothetical protein